MPWKQWAFMEKVPSDQFQSYLQNQTIPVFTGVAQRDTVYTPVPPPRGALCLTSDTLTVWLWDGTAWQKGGQSAPQTWYTYQPAGFAISTGGSTQALITVAALPPGDYLLSCSCSYTYPATTVSQCGYQFYRGTSATRLGDKVYVRGPRDSGLTCRATITFVAMVKNEAGGNVTYGAVVDCDSGTPSQGPMETTLQRITAMN